MSERGGLGGKKKKEEGMGDERGGLNAAMRALMSR